MRGTFGRPPRVSVALWVLALALAGCARVGPRTVVGDRTGYSKAIGASWKDQTLLNIVRLRYLDTPVFVEVGQVVASYSLDASVSAGYDDGFNLSGGGVFTNRPTITYTPLTGNEFVRELMTPIPPGVTFFMTQSGYPADLVLSIVVSSINGLRNTKFSTPGWPPDAFVSVAYRGHHYWIDDRDADSKRIFAFLMLLFSLSDTGGRKVPPLLSIPVR